MALLFLSIHLTGCGPKQAEQSDSRLGPRPTATPSTDPFRILLEVPAGSELSFKSTLERNIAVPEGWHLEWRPVDSYNGPWDVAFVRPFSLERLVEETVDLGGTLDEVFPLHKADFIVSASDLFRDGRLLGVPVLFLPHFLYAKDEKLATTEGLESHLSEGNKIALPPGESGEWYRDRLNVDSNRIVWTEAGKGENPFLTGEVEVAIADRSWLATWRVPPNWIHSLQGLELSQRVPDWGIRLAISNQCANRELAESILKTALAELQEKLVVAGGSAFPVRRSVYQSPRVQGAFFGAPKTVFDTTLENIGTPE